MTLIKTAISEEEILKCWEPIKALRPHLEKEKMLSMVNEMHAKEGYTLSYIEDDAQVVAIIGFRRMQTLYGGKTIYIDDLSTLPVSRKKGYAAKLLDYIIDLAKKEKLDSVHLDSGHARFDAHRLYLNKGFIISAHHFYLSLQ
jgi:GNAT superfamily N-acetyltransferase